MTAPPDQARERPRAAEVATAVLAGLLFGAGLAISGMADPGKILGFLDVSRLARRAWDPTLAVVMLAALLPMTVAWRVQRGMRRPLAAPAFETPTRTSIDLRLVGGAALFGVGWGIGGLCPGPAIAGISLVGRNMLPLAVFLLAMTCGTLIGAALRDRT